MSLTFWADGKIHKARMVFLSKVLSQFSAEQCFVLIGRCGRRLETRELDLDSGDVLVTCPRC